MRAKVASLIPNASLLAIMPKIISAIAILVVLALAGARLMRDDRPPEEVVTAYLEAAHGKRRDADLAALRTAELNLYLDCLRSHDAFGAEIDGTQDTPSTIKSLPATIEGESARVPVEETFETVNKILFTMKRVGDSWLIDWTTALALQTVDPCRKGP